MSMMAAHRFGTRLEPLWTSALGLARLIRPHGLARRPEPAAGARQHVSRQ